MSRKETFNSREDYEELYQKLREFVLVFHYFPTQKELRQEWGVKAPIVIAKILKRMEDFGWIQWIQIGKHRTRVITGTITIVPSVPKYVTDEEFRDAF